MRRGAEAGCGILTAGHGESIAIVETLVLCEFSGAAAVAAGGGVSVDVVIVAHNRPATLVRTLAELALVAAEVGGAVSLAVTIVDNASLAPIGVSDADEASAARVRLVRREQNAGILAFNEGAALGRAEFLFILDDDAWPDAGSLVEGLRVLRATPRLGAVALHPTHPVTKRGEWEFANGERAARVPAGRWPLLGCGVLVRRGAWEALGGYEAGFFLYTNDTDLALRLIASGWGVHGDLSLIVWHDCATAVRRPTRWFRLAGRNRVWLARRHLPWPQACVAAVAGWMDAHRRAGWRANDHAATLAGVAAGVFGSPPRIDPRQRCGAGPFWTMARLLVGSVKRRKA